MSSGAASTVRVRILDAAVDLLARHGPRGLAQPQVAKEAGVPQGHLTYYFPKKLDLVLAVAERTRQLLVAEVGPLLANASNAASPEGLERRLHAVFAGLAKDRGRTRMLLGLLAELDHEPAVRAELQAGFFQLRRAFALVMGRTEHDPDVDLAIATMWGLGIQHLLLEGVRTDADTDRIFARLGATTAARGNSRRRRAAPSR